MIRLLLSLFLVVVSLSAAEVVPGRFFVELEVEPALVPNVGGQKVRAASVDRLAAVRSAQARVRSAAADRGVQVIDAIENVANVLVVEGADADVAALASVPGVLRVRQVRVFKRLLDHAVVLQKVVDAWPLTGGMENAGRGIKIGIIDTGIDATHPGLQDPELTVPDGFPKLGVSSDLANTNSKVIVARNYDRETLGSARDIEGHGTGVAMIAAGRTAQGPMGAITGIAPKAYLGNYKVFPDRDSGAPEDAILKAIDDAAMDGMDIINLSLGSYPPENPNEDVLVRAVERASAAGVMAVIAAGNEGPDAGTVSSPATAPSVISVGNAYTDRLFVSSVVLDGAPPYVAVPGTGSNSTRPIAGPVKDVADLDQNGLACAELPPDSLRGQIAFILRGTCFFEEKLRFAERAGASAAIVYSHADSPAASTMDVGAARLPAVMISNADGLNARERIHAAAVAATINFSPTAMAVDPYRLSSSTSRGPSVDAALKPELLAIGTSIYTASASTTSQPKYQASTGTSFSSPMVAGALAVLKSARPGLSMQQYRSLIINSTAAFPGNSDTPMPVMQTGAGLLNLAAAIRSTVALQPQVLAFGATSASEDIVKTLAISNLGTSDDTFSIDVRPVVGSILPGVARTLVELTGGTSQEVEVRFSPGNAASGEHYGFLLVRNSAGNVEARVPYWFSVPSSTAASLSIIDLNPNAAESPGSKQPYLVRPTDAAGLALATEPVVKAIAGDGSVQGVQLSAYYPGFYVVDLRLGITPGENVFLIEAGGATQRITIVSQ